MRPGCDRADAEDRRLGVIDHRYSFVEAQSTEVRRPRMSSRSSRTGANVPDLACTATLFISFERANVDSKFASCTTATIRPRSVAAPMPRWMPDLTVISCASSDSVELGIGARSADTANRQMSENGVMTASGASSLRRLVQGSTHHEQSCAVDDHAARGVGNPLAGNRHSFGDACTNTLDWNRISVSVAGAANACSAELGGAGTAPRTSSRVISPSAPEASTVLRSTPRSSASLRTGGFARARARSTTGAGSTDTGTDD